MKRVLFYTETGAYGGAERALELVASELARRAYLIHVVVPTQAVRLTDSLREAGVSVSPMALRYKKDYPLPFIFPWLDKHNSVQLSAAIDDFKPDIVVINQPDPEEGIPAARAAKSKGTRVVSWLHTPHSLEKRGVRAGRFRSALCRRALEVFDGFIVPADGLPELLAASYGVDLARIAVATNGVEPLEPASPQEKENARATLGIATDKIVLAYAGRIHFASKGLDRFARAVKRLGDPAKRLVIIVTGEGPDKAALDVLAAQTDAKWIFQEWVPSVRSVLLAADAYVLPSRYEGLPLSALEAASMGLPVYVSAVGGCPAAFPDTALVEATDDAWARALLTIVHTGVRSEDGWWLENGHKYDRKMAASNFLTALESISGRAR